MKRLGNLSAQGKEEKRVGSLNRLLSTQIRACTNDSDAAIFAAVNAHGFERGNGLFPHCFLSCPSSSGSTGFPPFTGAASMVFGFLTDPG